MPTARRGASASAEARDAAGCSRVARRETLVAEAPAPILKTPISKAEPAAAVVARRSTIGNAPSTSDWDALIKRAELGGRSGSSRGRRHWSRSTARSCVSRSNLRTSISRRAPLVAQLEQKLGAALGGKIKIKFERDNGGAESPAEQHTRTESARRQAAEDALRSDPVVQSLIETFDARMIAGSVRPADGDPQ